VTNDNDFVTATGGQLIGTMLVANLASHYPWRNGVR